MIETQLIDNRLYVNIKDLSNWEKNDKVRSISPKNFQKLVASIYRSGIKSPLKIGEDGIVYDGNHRLKALYQLQADEVTTTKSGHLLELVPVTISNPQSEVEKWELALSGNSPYAYWNSDGLSNYLPEFEDELDMSLYNIDFFDPESMEEQLTEEEEEKKEEPQKVNFIICPNCQHEFSKPKK